MIRLYLFIVLAAVVYFLGYRSGALDAQILINEKTAAQCIELGFPKRLTYCPDGSLLNAATKRP